MGLHVHMGLICGYKEAIIGDLYALYMHIYAPEFGLYAAYMLHIYAYMLYIYAAFIFSYMLYICTYKLHIGFIYVLISSYRFFLCGKSRAKTNSEIMILVLLNHVSGYIHLKVVYGTSTWDLNSGNCYNTVGVSPQGTLNVIARLLTISLQAVIYKTYRCVCIPPNVDCYVTRGSLTHPAR